MTDESPSCEMDSHADTSVAGEAFILISEPTRFVTVSGYSPELKALPKVPVGSAPTTYVDVRTGKSYLLILHECVYFGKRLTHSLLNPNQLRMHGLIVDDTPRQFSSESTHSILDPQTRVRIPLTLKGVISGFETHLPTPDELETLPWIELTSDAEWHDSWDTMEQRELNISAVHSTHPPTIKDVWIIPEPLDVPLELQSNDDLHTALICAVNVSYDDIDGNGLPTSLDEDVYAEAADRLKISALSTKERESILTPEILSKRWHIGLEAARNTIAVTTHAGIRNVFLPSERKIRMKAPWLSSPMGKSDHIRDRS